MMQPLAHSYAVKIAMIALGCLVYLAAQADVYIYKNEWGSSLFSDRPLKQPGFRLMEVRSLTPKGKLMLTNVSSDSRELGGNLIKTSRYDNDITQTARSYDIDPALVKAVIHAESHFNPRAVSRVGAQGLMQLMPGTAAMYQVSNPFNPQENIEAGCRHLQYLMGKYNNIDLVLAAYNAGEGTVAQYNGIPPYSETRDYVRKVRQLQARYSKNTF